MEHDLSGSEVKPGDQDTTFLPDKYHYARRFRVLRVSLRLATVIASIVEVVESCRLLRAPLLSWVWSCVPAGVSILFGIIELSFIAFNVLRRRRWNGVHPGVAVGADLSLWLGCIPALVFLAGIAPHLYGAYNVPYRPLGFSAVMSPLVFMGIMLLAHFTLFVSACIETEQRNRMKHIRDILQTIHEHLPADVVGKLLPKSSVSTDQSPPLPQKRGSGTVGSAIPLQDLERSQGQSPKPPPELPDQVKMRPGSPSGDARFPIGNLEDNNKYAFVPDLVKRPTRPHSR